MKLLVQYVPEFIDFGEVHDRILSGIRGHRWTSHIDGRAIPRTSDDLLNSVVKVYVF